MGVWVPQSLDQTELKMKWILVWWMINPGHAQLVHREVYPTQAACEIAGGAIPAHNNAVRWHCSME
jgi:hypothetical protein